MGKAEKGRGTRNISFHYLHSFFLFLPIITFLRIHPFQPPPSVYARSSSYLSLRGMTQIKADRHETEHGEKDIEQLQKDTAKKANEAARAK